MKSNEEYLDELLQSMNTDGEEDSESQSSTLEENKVGLENLTDMDIDELDALLNEDIKVQNGEMDSEDTIYPAESLDMESAADTKGNLDIESLPQPEENFEQEQVQDLEENSMLAQLMAEMQEESLENDKENIEPEEEFEADEDIDALLNAAKNSSEEAFNQENIPFEAENPDDLAEIEALLNMSDGDGSVEDNMELLRMLEAQEGEKIPLKEEQTKEVDVAELEKILSDDSQTNEDTETIKEERKEGKLKKFFKKIIMALMEEIPEEEQGNLEQGMNLSEENKEILEELDKEEEEKVKVKEKKAKKEKTKKVKAEKPKKEKKVKVKEKEPEIPEKKLPKKKVIVAFAFALSILVLLLSLEFFALPSISLNSARKAFDSGEYYEAYKEYYGHKLSEEDEVKFQAATVIMRMQSNLDGYHNYMSLDNKVYALHSLLEAVHIKHDAFFKAEEFGVLSKVEAIYNEILELLKNQYSLSETEALEIVEEESDVAYTRRLEALAEGVQSSSQAEISEEDVLPEEEAIFEN